MADDVSKSMAKLQLDEETGDVVSKAELKKRQQKRAKKAAQEKARQEKAAAGPSKQAPTPAQKAEEQPIDPDAMFKQGFLDDVYKERPVNNVVTRFPPEPNGYLHIGHAKAIAVNFGFARHHGGVCYLRYDDTNPEGEEERYFASILEVVRWLGFEPSKITYSSDNFERLYEMAEKLVTLGKAYVCACNDAEMKLQRGGLGANPRYRCQHAEQSVEDNLAKFRDMRAGKYKAKEVILRMKQDITDGNPQMWDLAAYRIKTDQPHHRTGWDWKIYPTYDFTHCLCDSFEGITHSLCTTEFVLSRVSYEWLNKSLEVYEPMQREYGRLNLSGTVLSKRKLIELVKNKIVPSWDDPRLYTLIAIRRRGVPPGAILEFVNELGVTTSTTTIQIQRFEQTIRRYLEKTVPRLMMVLDPVPLVIEDAAAIEVELPFSPKDPKMGSHKVTFTSTVYIERDDFREVDSKDYFRLAPGKTVGLLNAPFPVKAVSFTKDEATGKVTEIRGVFDKETKKAKAYIQWVGTEGSRKVEARVHKSLFKSEKPSEAEGGFLNDVNPDSLDIYPEALIESGFDEVRRRAPWPEAAGESELGKGGPESVRFQAMRVAYFAMDSDTTAEKIVLNRIVSLKEDAGKKQ
ncbi:tRNA synthetases class I (E and q), catalytic domain-containing protein [Hirsutella rhossiliensis]|uniref:glutamine--tRNA ligase n=1 Tax=Hirsutella rhossiliensis TaxID=111463 RepID=A0A9P8MTJ4_9HYPO|nr:tRNA synthetases class I (E and q), catalytic domain-containing protein [Hirsutella rhossiliensis]KAH0959951.1 tRNA synthetases class I (E and q), catalytic domain-containing protein [Hirsutella rhossiliensis]